MAANRWEDPRYNSLVLTFDLLSGQFSFSAYLSPAVVLLHISKIFSSARTNLRTPSTAAVRSLMEIEAARAVVTETPHPLAAEAEEAISGREILSPDGLGAHQRMDRRRLAGGGGPLEARAVLRVIGNISAMPEGEG
jgi:hypothetical protein